MMSVLLFITHIFEFFNDGPAFLVSGRGEVNSEYGGTIISSPRAAFDNAQASYSRNDKVMCSIVMDD
jgi:hypothetical protein